MRKCTFDPGVLTVDVCDFMFFEWLNRHDLYSKFTSNLWAVIRNSKSPRAAIREIVAGVMIDPQLSLADVFTSSFVFQKTPEGFAFWFKVSREWKSFLDSFSFVI